jgi:hypothetical protein
MRIGLKTAAVKAVGSSRLYPNKRGNNYGQHSSQKELGQPSWKRQKNCWD